MKNTSPKTNWHSAAYSAIRIEFSPADNPGLTFLSEHLLNKKPRRIDMLIIREDPLLPMKNPLGSIFRHYNLIEYKSPRESLGINAFYKALSYALSFKSEPYGGKYVSIRDLSLTLIASRHPRKLFRYLRKHKVTVVNSSDGVYNIDKEEFPIQVIVTKELNPSEHIWLRCLTNQLNDPREIQMLSQAYAPHLDEPVYSNFMDIIIRANQIAQKGETVMCDALYELFAPQLKEHWDEGFRQGTQLGERRDRQMINRLNSALLMDDRSDDLFRSFSDPTFQETLLREYHLL